MAVAVQDKQKLQDAFLNYLRKKRLPVVIFLMNGVKLQGRVTAFDMFSLMLKRDDQCQMVYKHAVSTIVPSQEACVGDILEECGFSSDDCDSTNSSDGALEKGDN